MDRKNLQIARVMPDPGQLDKRLIICGAIAAIGLAMLVAGSVMLGVGVHKANSCPSPQPCPTTTTTKLITFPPTTTTTISPTAVFTTSYSPNITWDNALSNPNSQLFKTTQQSLQQQLYGILGGSTKNQARLAVTTQPSSITVNMFTPTSIDNNVNFYTTFLFPDGSTAANDVQIQMDASGYPTTAVVNPTANCIGVQPPPNQPSVTSSPKTASTSFNTITSQAPKTTKNLPVGVSCLPANPVRTVFLVDTAMPANRNLTNKLSQIKTYLFNYQSAIGLSNTGLWTGTQLQIVAYNGAGSYSSHPACNDYTCWYEAVTYLLPNLVNPMSSSAHTLSMGLNMIINGSFVPTTSMAGNIVIISDGFNPNDNYTSINDSQTLSKSQWTIGAVVVSPNAQIQDLFANIVTDKNAYMYPIGDYSLLNNPTVVQYSTAWTCAAQFTTAAPSTPKPTRPPVQISTTASTPRPTSLTQAPPIVTTCQVDVLFLIDESQSMLLGGFNESIHYAQSLASLLNAYDNNNRFALITFNDHVVFQSNNYKSLNDFINDSKSVPRMSGATDYVTGFQSAKSFIRAYARWNNTAVRPLLVFLTDGYPYSTDLPVCQQLSQDMRSTLNTQIIAIGLDETNNQQAIQDIEQAIDYGATDGYAQSQYISTTSGSVNSNPVLNTTISDITCKNGQLGCSTDITFVIEVSEAEGPDNIAVETQTVINLLNVYSGKFSAASGKTSLVYFSAPQNLYADQDSPESGILFSMVDSSSDAIASLQNKTFTIGGWSDLQLGFQLASLAISMVNDGNNQIVVFFARGAYENYVTCCNDPTYDAAYLRTLASVQGVVIGTHTNKAALDAYTGSNSVDATTMIVMNNNTVNVAQTAANIQAKLQPLIDAQIANAQCQPVPALVAPCQQFDDIVIILHSNTYANWNIITKFVSQQLIPALVANSSTPQQNSDFVNIAVIVYYAAEFGSDAVPPISPFNKTLSIQDLVNTVGNLPFVYPAQNMTASLSEAYTSAAQQFSIGRTFASKMVIVITDTVDVDDQDSAQFTAQEQLNGTFIYGMRVGAPIGSYVPGEMMGIVVVDANQINPLYPRTSVAYANSAANAVCRVYSIPTTTSPPTPPPTPAAPAVKARATWPDVTILVDYSFQNQSTFEAQRQLLRKTFLNQFQIGQKYSRFSVVKYSAVNTYVVCTFADTYSYYAMDNCLGSLLYYDVTDPHPQYSDVNSTFAYLNTNVFIYNSTADYRPDNVNYLFVFSVNPAMNNFQSSASDIRAKNIEIIGVDLSGMMRTSTLSNFGPGSFSVSNWPNSSNTNDLLSEAIVAQSTAPQKPFLASMFTDFYIIADQTTSVSADLPNVKEFIQMMVNQLTISQSKSRISVLPFNDPYGINLPLTSNIQDFNNFMSIWNTQPYANGYPDISNAIATASRQISYSGRTAFVIYIVGSNNITGYSQAAALSATNGVTTYVLQYNPNANYSYSLANSTNVFLPDGSGELLDWIEQKFPVPAVGNNQMNIFFNRMRDVQYGIDVVSYPMSEAIADIVIFVDQTGMSDSDFSNVKQYLVNLTSQFTVGPMNTQFALQSYNNHIIPLAGFHFYDCKTNADVVKKINGLPLVFSSADESADLAGAIVQALNNFLIPSAGWRQGSATFALIISNANNFLNNATSQAMAIKDIAKVIAMSTSSSYPVYLTNLTNTPYQPWTSSAASLNSQVGGGLEFIQDINKEYRQILYPQLVDLTQTEADFIFLWDNSNSAAVYNNMKYFTLNFIQSTSPSNRYAVINYDSIGVLFNNSFTLAGVDENMKTQIESFSSSMDTRPSDLNGAVGYFSIYPSAFGIQSNRAVFVVLLANSPQISSPLDQGIMNSVNLHYFTYALQSGLNTQQFNYETQFLGSDYGEDFSYIPNYQAYSTNSSDFANFNSYIQTQYTAFLNTH